MSSISEKIHLSSSKLSTAQLPEKDSSDDLENKQQLMSKDAEIDRLNMLVEQMKKESEKMKQRYESRIFEQAKSYIEKAMSLNSKIEELEEARRKDRWQILGHRRMISYTVVDRNEAVKRANEYYGNLDASLRSLKRKDDELLAERKMVRELKGEVKQKNGMLEKKERKILDLESRVEQLENEKECAQATGKPLEARIEWYTNRLEQVEKENEEMRAAQQEPIPMPVCQICRFQFDESPERTPRMLECGHTVCEECAGYLKRTSDGTISIQCPFDRRETSTISVQDLPKNFTVLEFIDNL